MNHFLKRYRELRSIFKTDDIIRRLHHKIRMKQYKLSNLLVNMIAICDSIFVQISINQESRV